MTVRPEILGLILLCALVTIVPRVLPFLAAHRMRLSPRAVAWFRFLPVAILSALLFPALLFPGGEWQGTILTPHILAGAIAAFAAVRSGNIIIACITGMLGYAALSAIFA